MDVADANGMVDAVADLPPNNVSGRTSTPARSPLENRSHMMVHRRISDGDRDFVRSCPMCGCGSHSQRKGRSTPLPPVFVAAAVLVPTLTSRERTAFELLGSGYGNRSIARSMGVSERTVKRYISAILAKLDVESRLQAGLVALSLLAES